MIVLKVEPGKAPVQTEIGNGLSGLQAAVNGYIEAIYPFEDPVAVICNEDGKNLGMEPNRALYDADGQLYDIICGPFVMVGLTEEDFGDLLPHYMDKYTEHFKDPERFYLNSEGRIRVVKVIDPDAICWRIAPEDRKRENPQRTRGGEAR